MFTDWAEALEAESLPLDPTSAQQLAAAARLTARSSHDKHDMTLLLDALGLPTDPDTLTALLPLIPETGDAPTIDLLQPCAGAAGLGHRPPGRPVSSDRSAVMRLARFSLNKPAGTKNPTRSPTTSFRSRDRQRDRRRQLVSPSSELRATGPQAAPVADDHAHEQPPGRTPPRSLQPLRLVTAFRTPPACPLRTMGHGERLLGRAPVRGSGSPPP